MTSESQTSSTIKYGERLIPSFVDELAHTRPDQLFALVPKCPRYGDGLIDVTIKAFARAINRTATWMESKIGRSDNFETVAYIGPSKYYPALKIKSEN